MEEDAAGSPASGCPPCPNAARVTTTDPCTGAPPADLPVSTPEDVEAAFARARTAQKTWAATPIAERKKVLLRYHDLVFVRQDQAPDLMQAENGETRNEAFAAARGSVDAPMGGMGDSGLGRRHGADGILQYTEPQTVAHQRLQGFHPPARVSPETWTVLLGTALRVMKKVGMR
ncbi:aldehyde dehydrogenase family protein [Streptomyces sp. NPDC057235]|uniref:aldehyde dehydrogenase family protein n=1 Tax=unclassified Streptomyces TaxID=2593676 RepID=UPI00362F1C5B